MLVAFDPPSYDTSIFDDASNLEPEVAVCRWGTEGTNGFAPLTYVPAVQNVANVSIGVEQELQECKCLGSVRVLVAR